MKMMEVEMITYGDYIRIEPDAPACMRPGAMGSVVGIYPRDDRSGDFLAQFPVGTVFEIEISDGSTFLAEEQYVALVSEYPRDV